MTRRYVDEVRLRLSASRVYRQLLRRRPAGVEGTFTAMADRAFIPLRARAEEEEADLWRVEIERWTLILVRTHPGKGARSLWLCPACLSRRSDLFAWDVTEVVACRKCLGLAYRSENLSRWDRIRLAYAVACARLGTNRDSVLRPKGRTRRVHHRLIARREKMLGRLEDALMVRAERCLRRLETR